MTPILALRKVHYRYAGRAVEALGGVDVEFPRGQRIALIGRNGSGKSTLLLHCNGILRPQQGEVWLEGQRVTYDRRGLLHLRRRVGLVLQNPEEQLFSASVRQDISFGPLNLGLDEAAAQQRVAEAAELCRITHLLDRPTHALSGGEKARVALAGVLAMDPQLLIADEIAGGLDPWMQETLYAILDQLVQQGKTVVLATHDLAVARKWADLVIFMREGRVQIVAPPAQVFSDPAVLAATELDQVLAG
ncbi:MAG: energy-coupling factor ABC transporter ATP-binding protein [Anaerolineae bacterium]